MKRKANTRHSSLSPGVALGIKVLTHQLPHKSTVHPLVDSSVEDLHFHTRSELPFVRVGTVVEGGMLRVALDRSTLQEELKIGHGLRREGGRESREA